MAENHLDNLIEEKDDANVYDPRSGLHTRAYLLNAIGASHVTPEEGGACKSVVYAQVERFRDYNEVYGHEQGNLLLKDIGLLLRDVFRTDAMARLYADQFAVFYIGEDVDERCEELRRRGLALRPGFPIHLGVGVFYADGTGMSPAREIDCAKLAYDNAVRTGKGSFGVYSEELAREQRLDAHIVENVDEAIQNGHLTAVFQPVVRTVSEEVSCFEALARWNDPVYGAISPGRFIPLLEERLLAYKVDAFMAEQACALLRSRIDAGLSVVPISVNLSRTDFDHRDPVAIVADPMRRHRIPPRLIAIEITETVAMEKPEAVRDAIARFHERGHEVWMDDFGSAYSSLNVLRSFAFDEIKIDMAFMSSLDDKTRSIVTSIVGMAKKLGMRTLAEGVETEEQASFLRSIGCNRIQGFLFGRPMPADNAGDWLRLTHALLESPEDAALHDEGGLTAIDPQASQALLRDEGGRFSAMFVSVEMGRALGAQDRAGAIRATNVLVNGTVSSFGPLLRHAVEIAGASGEAKGFYATVGTGRYGSTVRTIADNGTARIVLLSFEVLADSSSSDDASRREMLMRSVTDSFDIVYLVDPKASTVEVVFSAVPGEHVGDILEESSLKTFDLVHPDDRLRFLRCFDSAFVARVLAESESGSFSVLIRMRLKEGGYEWREFSFLRIGVGDAGDYLLFGRRYPLVEDDCELVSRAILSGVGSSDIPSLQLPARDLSGAPLLAGTETPFPYLEVRVLRDDDGSPVDFVYLAANEAYARRVKRTPEQLVGRRYLEMFPQGNPHWPAQFGRALELGHQVRSVIYGTAAESWVECCIAPLHGTDRVGIVFVSSDTAHGLSDQELFGSYHDMPIPCLVVRPATIDGREDSEYVYMNDEYCRLVGKSREELQGHGYRELFSVATTEWVDLVRRAAKGERVHERIWGSAQHHWMDVRFAPSSVLGCAVVVGVPVDEEHRRISELTTARTTDIAALDIVRKIAVGTSYESAMDSAVYALGKALRARYLYIFELRGKDAEEGALTRFAYEDARSVAFGFPKRALQHLERYRRWNAALADGMLVVSKNVPLSTDGRFERVDLPPDEEWADVDNLMVAPVLEGGRLVGMLVAIDSDMEHDVDAVALFGTVAPFFQARFVEHRTFNRAEYDALTGVRSRGALESAMRRAGKATAGVGLAFADINDLKATNDKGGHLEGDRVLKRAAGLLSEIFDRDNVYRVGGDEFVALLVDVDERRFAQYREALLERLGAERDATLSVGFAWTPNPEEASSLVKVADERMYQEKDAYHSSRRPAGDA